MFWSSRNRLVAVNSRTRLNQKADVASMAVASEHAFTPPPGAWIAERLKNLNELLAGLLVFGQDTSIREVFPYYFLDYQERPELQDPSRWLERITPDGTWSGNLFDFFRRVIPRIKSDLKELRDPDNPTIPDQAYRTVESSSARH